MKPSRRKWIIGLAVLVAVGGVWLLSQRNTGLRYQGKTVRQWLNFARPTKTFQTNGQQISFSANYIERKDLQRMLETLGSNAAPALVQILDDGDSLTTKLKLAVTRTKWVPAPIKSAFSSSLYDSHETLLMASYALRYLGSNAIPAIHDLERITCDSEKYFASYAAGNALAGLGFHGLPALRRSLTNAPLSRQAIIGVQIRSLHRDAFQSGDARLQEEAALGLCEFPRPPFEVIFVLLDMLKAPDIDRQKQGLKALSKHLPTMAPSLTAARKAVTNATTSADPDMRRMANGILEDLARFDSKQKP